MGRVVHRIEQDARYWSPRQFRDWCDSRLGADSSLSQIAAALGITKAAVADYMLGRYSPNLETYLRMIATVGEPLGTWLDHVSLDVAGSQPTVDL